MLIVSGRRKDGWNKLLYGACRRLFMGRYAQAVLVGLVLMCGHSAAKAQSTGFAGTRYVCSEQGQRRFAIHNGPGCSVLPREEGWENVLSAPNILVDVQPTTIVRDGNSVKIWVRTYLNQTYPYVSQQGENKGDYDGTKGVFQFLCGKRQQIIVQADYTLAGTPIYYRLSNESVTEEIEPGTVAEILYAKYCPG